MNFRDKRDLVFLILLSAVWLAGVVEAFRLAETFLRSGTGGQHTAEGFMK